MKKSFLKLLTLGVLAVLLPGIGCRKADPDDEASQNVWRRPLFTKLQTLDAGNLSDAYSIGVASQIYEPLYEFKYLVRPFEMQPLTAADFPEISDDHLTYTIRIRQGTVSYTHLTLPTKRIV